MNAKIIITAFVLLGVVGAVYFWQLGGGLVSKATDTTSSTTPDTTSSEEKEVPLTGKSMLGDIMRLGKNLECTITLPGAGSTPSSEGTAFFSGGKLRGDFMSTDNGTSTVSSMIISEDILYTWSSLEGATYGVKVDLKKQAADTEGLDAREPVGLSDEVRYNCMAWAPVDKSVFAPPSDILFQDLGEIQAGGMEYGTTFEQSSMPAGDACSLCDSIESPESKKSCRADFKCR